MILGAYRRGGSLVVILATFSAIGLDMDRPFCETPHLKVGSSAFETARFPMFSSLTLVEKCQLGRLGRLALVIVCLGMAGCCNSWNLRGDGFPDDELAHVPQQVRPKEPTGVPYGFSNKARQIESNLGYR